MKCICQQKEAEPNASTCGHPLCQDLEAVATKMFTTASREGQTPHEWTDRTIEEMIRNRRLESLPPDRFFVTDDHIELVRRRYKELRGVKK